MKKEIAILSMLGISIRARLAESCLFEVPATLGHQDEDADAQLLNLELLRDQMTTDMRLHQIAGCENSRTLQLQNM